MEAAGIGQWGRAALATASIAVIGLLFLPVITRSDDFPLSTQPMFAAAREPLAEFVTARAFDAEGAAIDLSIEQIAQTDDPLVAERVLADAVSNGELRELCSDIATRVVGEADSVEVISVVRDLDEPDSGAGLVNLEVLERCNVQ